LAFLGRLPWVAETLWCRDRLRPTAGEFCLGIRYLTSSSSQVVADIQVLHSKLKLNGFLVAAGVVELTLAVLLLSGWTFLGKAAALGWVLPAPLSMVYWALMGIGCFTCGGLILGASRQALWAVPAIHAIMAADLRWSQGAWGNVLREDVLLTGGSGSWGAVAPFLWQAFLLWGIIAAAGLALSRKHLTQ
jgi:hypothetical protein